MENLTFTYPSHTTKGCVPLSSDVTLVIESYEADSSGFEKSYSVAKWEVDTGTFVFQNDSETQKSVG